MADIFLCLSSDIVCSFILIHRFNRIIDDQFRNMRQSITFFGTTDLLFTAQLDPAPSCFPATICDPLTYALKQWSKAVLANSCGKDSFWFRFPWNFSHLRWVIFLPIPSTGPTPLSCGRWFCWPMLPLPCFYSPNVRPAMWTASRGFAHRHPLHNAGARWYPSTWISWQGNNTMVLF